MFLIAAGGLAASCVPDLLIQVTTFSDGGAGSLRAAIAEANSASRTVRIRLPNGTYALTICGGDDSNAAGDLDVTASGAVFIEGTGPNVVIRQNCEGERLFDGRGTGLLSFRAVTLTGGSASGNGGAIQGRDVHLVAATVTGNRATVAGGGIAATTLIAEDSTVTNNSLPTDYDAQTEPGPGGGGIYVTERALVRRSTISNNVAPFAGGIAAGSLEMFDTTLSDNLAENYVLYSGRWPSYTAGGALIADALYAERVTLANNALSSCPSTPTGFYYSNAGAAFIVRTGTLINATITGNVSPDCIQREPHSVMKASESLTLTHSTVVENDVGSEGEPWLSPATHLRNSVIIRDSWRGCARTDMIDDDYNWISEANCGATGEIPQTTVEFLQLGPLASNGGAVATREPAATSALVNAIPAAGCAASEDARGVARPQGGGCDIGAVEVR